MPFLLARMSPVWFPPSVEGGFFASGKSRNVTSILLRLGCSGMR